MKEKEYNRKKVVEYANEWAYKRNKKYYDFDSNGGDCTSFVSQCIYAGCNTMNYKKYIGWYYNSVNDRTASWSGVEFLYDFLVNNKGIGPSAKQVNIEQLEIGDIIQLKFFSMDRFSHSLIVVDKKANNLEDIFIASHTEDTYYKKVSEYNFDQIRFLHINDKFYIS